jgi:cell division protease FtsH
MGGRASEQLLYDGDISSGAADDLQRATEIALEMVTRYGMDPQVGQRTYAPPSRPFLAMPTGDHVQAAELTTREIDVAVRDLLGRAAERAGEILRARRGDLDAGVELLLKRETITADDFPPLRSPKIATEKAATEPRLSVVPAAG